MSISIPVTEDVVRPLASQLPAPIPITLPFHERVAELLLKSLGQQRFELWFDNKTRFSLDGNALIVDAPNAFFADRIRSKFSQELSAAACHAAGRTLEVSIHIDESATSLPTIARSNSDIPPHPAVTSEPAAQPSQSLINPRYTLDEFVVGPSNQIAYHAALKVAQNPGRQFNPLFLHGSCGLGKTHLLQGICQRFSQLHPGRKWLYITGEQFTNEFLEAIRLHKTDAFRKRIRSAELLVIDDVHFFGNKKATQEEFLHTFNQIDALGKQIVLASDCAPRQIHALSEQLSSRFVSGMVLRIDSPDLPTRLEILRRRVQRNAWNISDAVLMHIAQSSASSVRELEGLLLQVVAGIKLINSGNPEAATVLAGIKNRTALPGPIPVDRIVAAVAAHFSLQSSAILSSLREKTTALARSIAMFLARRHTGMSFPEIGRALGNKNHSTVIAACQRVEALLSSGRLLSWNTPDAPRHQSMPDLLHELESALRCPRLH